MYMTGLEEESAQVSTHEYNTAHSTARHSTTQHTFDLITRLR